MAMPPMVGVPAFTMCPWGPSSRMGWPIRSLVSASMRKRVPTSETKPASATAMRSLLTGWSTPDEGTGLRSGAGGTSRVFLQQVPRELRGDLAIVERDHAITDGLGGLVALAG